jgi:hypothetical protein
MAQEVNEFKLRENIARGQRVKRLLDDEDLAWCLSQVRDELFEVWNDPESVQQKRDEAFYLNCAMNRLVRQMGATVSNGKAAESRLESFLNAAKQKLRQFATR